MKVTIKGVYAKRKNLACGQVRVYYYHRRSGARLPDDPRAPEFSAAVHQLD